MSSFIGEKAFDFVLTDQNYTEHSLSNYLGSYVLLYFYPKDNTPGCTIEARCFRDMMKDLQAAGVVVLGVSVDSIESHQKFATLHNLNFPLLADIDKQIVKKYGVWGEKKMFGKTFMGIRRESFLIDPQGIIIKHYKKVRPQKHPDEVREDVLAMKK